MMLLRQIGGQYRAYCAACTLGRTWWADDEGKESAEEYVKSHNTGHGTRLAARAET